MAEQVIGLNVGRLTSVPGGAGFVTRPLVDGNAANYPLGEFGETGALLVSIVVSSSTIVLVLSGGDFKTAVETAGVIQIIEDYNDSTEAVLFECVGTGGSSANYTLPRPRLGSVNAVWSRWLADQGNETDYVLRIEASVDTLLEGTFSGAGLGTSLFNVVHPGDVRMQGLFAGVGISTSDLSVAQPVFMEVTATGAGLGESQLSLVQPVDVRLEATVTGAGLGISHPEVAAPGDVLLSALMSATGLATSVLRLDNTTTTTEYIYILGDLIGPGQPTGGTTNENHLPSGWTRTVLAATATMSVWRSQRELIYTAGPVFWRATDWSVPEEWRPHARLLSALLQGEGIGGSRLFIGQLPPDPEIRHRVDARGLGGENPLFAMIIEHDDLTSPVRIVADVVEHVIEGDTYQPVAFGAVEPQQATGEIPEATIEVDNVGEALMDVLEETQGGSGAIMTLMKVIPPHASEDESTVVWRVPGLAVGTTKVVEDVVQIKLVGRSGRRRSGVKLRHTPVESPGLF